MKNLLEKLGGFLALFLMLGWFVAQTFGGLAGTALFGAATPVRLFAGHTLAALFLLGTIRAVLSCSEKAGVTLIRFGNVQRADVLILGGMMFAGYALERLFTALCGIQAETYMQDLLSLPPWQLSLMLVTVILVAPISEELLFRHVLPGLPAEAAPKIGRGTWVRMILSALLFMWIHSQYKQTSTLLLMLWVAVVCTAARWRTGGLALPVGLHGFASILALGFHLLH